MRSVVLLALAALVVIHAQADPCPSCVYTQGYWKTHGPGGNAPYDSTWDPYTGASPIKLCGLYLFQNVLDNNACQLIGNVAWCNVARQYVAVVLNLVQDSCVASSALAFNTQLASLYATQAGLCVPTPNTYATNANAVTLFTSYNEGQLTNGPCHCGSAGCGDAPVDEDPQCHLVCKCDLMQEEGGETCIEFCALTQGYWKNHQENWPTNVDPHLCGLDFLTIWNTATHGNKWYILAHQYLAAVFNTHTSSATGCVPVTVSDALAAALALLTSNCDLAFETVAQTNAAVDLSTLLDAFNNGNVGDVEHCPGGPNSGTTGTTTAAGEPRCLNCEPQLDCCPVGPPPPPEADLGCTLTQGYWKNHDENWPISTSTQLCGLGELDILQTPPTGGDAWYILAHQYIAAILNQASGAFVPVPVAQALADALALLQSNCHTIPTNDADHAEATALAAILDNYNNGLAGVPHCGDQAYQGTVCTPNQPPPPPHVCIGGCTYSQGYWKTHEPQWPSTWQGAQYCGVNWITLFNTAPKNGNTTIILLYQYMAALLNVANGACTTPAVATALLQAQALLNNRQCQFALPASATTLATLLEAFNTGLIGPGHCDALALLGPSINTVSTNSLVASAAADDAEHGVGVEIPGSESICICPDTDDIEHDVSSIWRMTVAILSIVASTVGLLGLHTLLSFFGWFVPAPRLVAHRQQHERARASPWVGY